MGKRRELSVSEKTRIIASHQQGVSFRSIEKQLGIARATCNKVWQKWLVQGSVDTKKRSGRPVKFTPRVVAVIEDYIKAHDEATSEDIEKELVRRFGGAYSSSARSI